MPNRILRDWTDSDKFDGISPEAERLFVRLLMKADDYGRFHAEARRVKAACFPLILNLRPTDIDGWLLELAERRLILRYRVEDRDLLAIPRFRQRLKKSVPKFPPASGMRDDWLPDDYDFPEVPGSSRNIPLDANADVESDANAKPPSPRGVKMDPIDEIEIPPELRCDSFLAAWMRWRKHRREIGHKLKPTMAEAMLRNMAAMGSERAIAAIDYTIGKGWQGLQEPNGVSSGKYGSRTAAVNGGEYDTDVKVAVRKLPSQQRSGT